MTEQDVHGYLDALADANLVQATGTPGRFQFHDLIRIFAAKRWEAEKTRKSGHGCPPWCSIT